VLNANPEFYFIFNEIANKFRTDEFSMEEHRKAKERKRRAECAPGWTQDECGPPKAMAVA